ncbi:nucleoprotein TPR isoform X2 [Wyeomyia smithii]|uniref:nucleoprotein TPR isoform X2 n=1 Tax=Wyeomyia smithii TaxID=174621 RepID=UPI002467D5E3|nr:nucleoprotein TPR isoform X2 [Wyeomyia smithii]
MEVDEIAEPAAVSAVNATVDQSDSVTPEKLPDPGGILRSVLSAAELDVIAPETVKKIETHYEQKLEEFLTAKALCETAKTNVEQLKGGYETRIEELTLKYQDESSKFQFSQQSVKELRLELEDAKQELTQANEKVRQNDASTARFRRERNEAVNERDTLLNAVERKTLEVERLQADVIGLEQKLKAANVTKCEALAKLEEIQSKEFSLDFKEKRMDKELSMRDIHIQKLSEDLNRALQDLQNVRREQNFKALTTEAKLAEKTEELKIATAQIAHLNEQNQELSEKAEDLTTKLLQQNEETRKMMDHYRKELQSQTKLCELYQEDCEDNKKQTEELGAAVSELKKLLNEASDAYGKLETQQKAQSLKHEKELESKEQTIQQLKDELKNANELLKLAQEESLEHAVEKLAPSAAATSRLIKSGMTLTELYTLYVKTAEDLQVEKKENSKLQLQIKNIVQELEERAPELTRQQNEYQNLKDANEEMSLQLNKLIEENAEVRSELGSVQDKVRFLDSENKKFKLERGDLSRQICHLLREIEQMRGGYASEADQSISSDMSANEVITKKLVTFNDIRELQENNVKLLLVVRDFSAKLEELEIAQNAMSQATFEAKIASYNKRLQEMQETQEYQTQMMQQCIQQRDRYKKMYHDAMRSYNAVGGKGNIGASLNGSVSGDTADAAMDEELPSASTVSAISSEAVAEKEKKISELENKVKQTQQMLTTLKEEYDNYRKEKLTNDKMMNEQFDAMRTELRELSSKNIKLAATVEYNNEQIKIQQKNVATYKKQISTLEERNKNYETTISKQEATIMFLKDETMSAQSKLARAEVQVENLKHECRILKDAESRLQTEREILNRERQNQNLLLNNLEMIKVTMERSEAEGRIRLETRLDETSRECSALRRRLQEEQDRFRELTTHLERQMQTAKQRMEEETAIAETVQAELKNARDELEIKSRKIDDLSRKLQETLSPNDEDNPVTQAHKKIRELEQKLKEADIEVESLRKELATAKEHVKQYCNMSESSEKELKDLSELYNTYKTQSEAELGTLRKSESNLKAQVEELRTEISLKKTGEQLTSSTDSDSELHKAQLELKDALEKISDNNRDLRDLREKNNSLMEQLQLAEQKYANEMVQHSSDIQQLANLKEEVQKTKLQFDDLKQARDQAIERVKTSEECWNNREEIMKKEIDQLEERLTDLNSQNAALHDQIQSLSTKLSITAAQALEQTKEKAEKIDDSMNDSTTINEDSSILNRSVTDEEKRSVDQLLQIIKYLRKEKDIAVAQFDILRSENVRVRSELMMFQKKLEDAQAELSAEREKSETGVVTTAKHEEILRKLETLNAITDSNRSLREERDGLNKKIKDLSERLLKAEDELFPLQEKVRELSVKIESATSENSTLRLEATRWRQRANLLIERSNKTSPEDWKRLQTERENLAKMLTNEKELLKKSNEELNSIRIEKGKLDTEVTNLTKQLASANEQNKKYADELDVLRQAGAKMTVEIGEVKSTLSKRDEDMKNLTEELANKEEQLTDAKNKEQQIRKIAKRYKDYYFGLKKTVEEKESEDGKPATEAGAAETAGEGSSNESNKITENNVTELKSQITSSQEEIENLKKENDTLKGKLEKAERNQDILKDVKHRILSLTEMKNNVTRELNNAKAQIQSLEHVRDENELLKSQYEGRISRITKENADQDKEKADAITRLTRENEQLTMRLNQLTRQLGLQQVSKPSTSASGSSEKTSTESPRTANVKPIPGPSSAQQSATVTPRRGSETPLASIRPMSVQASSRTAAVLPTSQTSNNVAIVQGSSSSSSSSSNTGTSVTALVPPQQQVHTTGSNNNSNESMSSSPTSSHTDYMPATSSANVAVAAVPPMGTASTSSSTAESSSLQENESLPAQQPNEPGPSQMHVSGGQQLSSQAVALVSPHIEGSPAQTGSTSTQVAQSSPQLQQSVQEQQNPAPSTSGSSSNAQQLSLSSHHQASTSSNTVTTSQGNAGHKRPRDVEGDSSTDTVEQLSEKSAPVNKRTRMQGETFQRRISEKISPLQGISESGLDVEYQVPTSSQRDQEDDIIVVDSEEDEEGMADDGTADEGNAEADDGPFEGYEAEEAYEQDEPEIAGNYDEGEGPDIDEDNVQSANNEVDVDDDNEVPNQSGTSSTTSSAQVAPDVETSSTSVGQSSNAGPTTSSDGQPSESGNQPNSNEVQQIQSITSGSGEPSGPSTSSATSTAATAAASTSASTTSSSTSSSSATAAAASSATSQAMAASPSQSRRQVNPLARQQQQQLMLMQQNYDESADDRIVPSTPTLYVPRRTDGFSEAVSSPHPQVPNARFIFVETSRGTATTGGAQLLPEGIDDTRMDLSQLDESGANVRPTGRSVPTTPQQTSPNEHERAVIHGGSSSAGVTEGNEAEQAGGEQLAPCGSSVNDVELANEPVAGPSGVGTSAPCESEREGQVPEITVSAAEESAILDRSGVSSEATAAGSGRSGERTDEDDMDLDMEDERDRSTESADGVTSEGEKHLPANPMDEGREADGLETPSSNTRSRSVPRASSRRGRRFGQRGSTTTRNITWNEGRPLNRSGPSVAQLQHHSRSPIGSPNRMYHQGPTQQQHSHHGQQQSSPPMRRNTRSTRNRRSNTHYRP